jgi:arginase
MRAPSWPMHLDADCLDDGLMPAVDYRLPGGLSREEVDAILRAALGMGRCVGLEVAIYSPALDADGSAGRQLADVLVGALRPGGR